MAPKRPLEVYCAAVNKIRARMDGWMCERTLPYRYQMLGWTGDNKESLKMLGSCSCVPFPTGGFNMYLSSAKNSDFFTPSPLSYTEFTQPRSLCLLLGDPPLFISLYLRVGEVRLGDDFCWGTRGILRGAAAPERKAFSLILCRRIHTSHDDYFQNVCPATRGHIVLTTANQDIQNSKQQSEHFRVQIPPNWHILAEFSVSIANLRVAETDSHLARASERQRS